MAASQAPTHTALSPLSLSYPLPPHTLSYPLHLPPPAPRRHTPPSRSLHLRRHSDRTAAVCMLPSSRVTKIYTAALHELSLRLHAASLVERAAAPPHAGTRAGRTLRVAARRAVRTHRPAPPASVRRRALAAIVDFQPPSAGSHVGSDAGSGSSATSWSQA